ncbi:ribose 5-phosphate isomerase B [Oscillibacter sp.]|uniref:ribose 5-phosphate isomerase B n=1 Tax=Oscillibacter sp. TaxID=1945593 RepID=UPI0033993CD7
MKIALGSDHGGFELKEKIKQQLEQDGYTCKDCGCFSAESCDYPVFGEAAARAVASGECEMGIVVCTTGIGISISANKIKGIRCAHCADTLEAQLCRQHNNANMLALGAGFTGPKLAAEMVKVFLNTDFEGGRHARRVALMDAIEG